MKISNYISTRWAAALCCAAFASFLTPTSYAGVKHVNIFHVLGIDRGADDSKGQDKNKDDKKAKPTNTDDSKDNSPDKTDQ